MEQATKIKICNVVRGDIIWLKKGLSFDLGDNIQSIGRPYVVISNNVNNCNNKSPIVNLACLSKRTNKANFPMHVLIKGEKYGMEFDSVIYVEQLMTVNKDQISDKIARLDNEDLKKLDKAIFIQLINPKQPVLV